MTLPVALRKALAIVRDRQRAVHLESAQTRYRLIPEATTRGYTLWLSMRYDREWQPWGAVNHFDMEDILNDKWRIV